jgi:hypothetical protein
MVNACMKMPAVHSALQALAISFTLLPVDYRCQPPDALGYPTDNGSDTLSRHDGKTALVCPSPINEQGETHRIRERVILRR